MKVCNNFGGILKCNKSDIRQYNNEESVLDDNEVKVTTMRKVEGKMHARYAFTF